MGGIAAFLCITYSGTIFRFSYRGLGEIIIGLMFGPLLILGIFFSCVGQHSFDILFVSVPVGLLVSNIIFTHSILDYDADIEVNKMTLAVLIGNKK